MNLGYKKIIVALGILLLLIPIFFERIHDDEAFYWNQTKMLISSGLIKLPEYRMPLAILIVSPFLLLNDSIFTPRLISVLFSIASAIIISEIVKLYSDEKAAFISSLLFIFSFQTIRFGTRFYLDAYGVFFFLLSIYFIKKMKMGTSGLSFGLVLLSREIWFGLYPFMILYSWRKKSTQSFLVWSLLPLVLFAFFINYTVGFEAYFENSGFAQTSRYISANIYKIPLLLIQSWVEFSIIHIITIFGFVYWFIHKKDDLIFLILPQFLVLTLVPGFILNGAFTQYVMGLQASMALFAGPGISLFWKKYIRKYPLELTVILILLLQLLLFSYLATVLSLRGAIGVHDFGYWYDEEVITLLNQKAVNESIAGLHGAFIKDTKEWFWPERNVEMVLEKEPDWYVVVEPQVIKFKTDPSNIKDVEVYYIGHYIILHSNPRGHLHELIESNEEFNEWMLRG